MHSEYPIQQKFNQKQCTNNYDKQLHIQTNLNPSSQFALKSTDQIYNQHSQQKQSQNTYQEQQLDTKTPQNQTQKHIQNKTKKNNNNIINENINLNITNKFKENKQQQHYFIYSVPQLIQPAPLDCIIQEDEELGGLYLGNLDAALDTDILKKHKIRAVLTTSIETGFRYAEEAIHFHESLPAHDKVGYDITLHFENGIEFIDRHRKYTNVLVHCFAGVSRSASIQLEFCCD
ncbi:hypothetical protein IMG5_169020 [Ichthyophthirius multifiliis]|uniref:protein-tyrosine-phosphatase n=1 Tax=Ichthyophthirius multifiliis TaxID=5932 RepID=G0R181_ICHMU|nr:hypothetical protein IMG5_169020 [Ichthyophthirius multifiliis]EGR28766.1 hypothetical protein IMG5_169020 [Ichthyophthirius multifiliis]|eukprot:XP_004030002.1 hypothetical protein IMG5_169020 [Ichthyophthirius multifiliis]